MKIALCFSGQPRYIDKSFEQYQKGIFEKNDVDVFAHMWWDESYKGKTFVWESDDTYPVEYDPMEEFVSKFRPKEIIIEPHKPKEYFGYDDFPTKCAFDPSLDADIVRSIITRQRSQWYSINQSMSFESLKDYDMIIRARTDLEFSKPLDFSKFDTDKIYMMDGSIQCGAGRHYQDWFWFGPLEYMKKVNETYGKILAYYQDGLRHMHELIEQCICDAEVPGEISDLGVTMMKRGSIDIKEQRRLIKENSKELQVDLK